MANQYNEVLQYSELINSESLNVTFNGTLYENVPRQTFEEGVSYGYGEVGLAQSGVMDNPSFPFFIGSQVGQGNTLFVPSSYQNQNVSLSASVPSNFSVDNITPCFKEAVKESVEEQVMIVYKEDPDNSDALNKTATEILDAYESGKEVKYVIVELNGIPLFASLVAVHVLSSNLAMDFIAWNTIDLLNPTYQAFRATASSPNEKPIMND